jgi:2Fe-2S ferredoxin
MARIMIENLFKMTLSATDYSRTLLKHFQRHGLDWMHACGGKGRCTTCKVIVLEGGENFQPLTKAEIAYRQIGALLKDERLACQAQINGDVCVLIPPECKLPHVRYSDDGPGTDLNTK